MTKIAFAIATLALFAVRAVGAEESVAECLDQARHATVSSRRNCLERSFDPEAIPAFHRLALEVAATRTSGRPPLDFWRLAEGAGYVAVRTNDRFLREKLGSGDVWDQLFAMRALGQERMGLGSGGADALERKARVEQELQRACDALERAEDERLRSEARKCQIALVPRDLRDFDLPPSSRSPRGGRPALTQAPVDPGARPAGGLGMRRPPPAYASCLRGGLPPGTELCVVERGDEPRPGTVLLHMSTHRGLGAAAAGKFAREELSLDGEDLANPVHAFIAKMDVELEGHEVIPPGKHRLVPASPGDVIFLPVIRGKGARGGARAVLVGWDRQKQAMGPVWTSRRCTSRCAMPIIDLTETAAGTELRVRLRDGEAGERVRWSGAAFVPVEGRGGPGAER